MDAGMAPRNSIVFYQNKKPNNLPQSTWDIVKKYATMDYKTGGLGGIG